MDTAATAPPPVDVTPLRREMAGQVLLPGDDGYDAARSVWNAMVDRRPAVVARCRRTADVAAAVQHSDRRVTAQPAARRRSPDRRKRRWNGSRSRQIRMRTSTRVPRVTRCQRPAAVRRQRPSLGAGRQDTFRDAKWGQPMGRTRTLRATAGAKMLVEGR